MRSHWFHLFLLLHTSTTTTTTHHVSTTSLSPSFAVFLNPNVSVTQITQPVWNLSFLSEMNVLLKPSLVQGALL